MIYSVSKISGKFFCENDRKFVRFSRHFLGRKKGRKTHSKDSKVAFVVSQEAEYEHSPPSKGEFFLQFWPKSPPVSSPQPSVIYLAQLWPKSPPVSSPQFLLAKHPRPFSAASALVNLYKFMVHHGKSCIRLSCVCCKLTCKAQSPAFPDFRILQIRMHICTLHQNVWLWSEICRFTLRIS